MLTRSSTTLKTSVQVKFYIRAQKLRTEPQLLKMFSKTSETSGKKTKWRQEHASIKIDDDPFILELQGTNLAFDRFAGTVDSSLA